jgi:leucyl/phenylalanyl-tRNA--protein transferase
MPTSHYQDWASFEFPVPGPEDGPEDGPVAFCADLSPASVRAAYQRGLIPLPAPDDYFRTLNEVRYEDQVAAGTIAVVGDERDDPYRVAWWSPNPRPLIGTGVHLGRNVRKLLRREELTTTANTAFEQVAEACRADREPRWLTDELLATLTELHGQGRAHSIEVWLDGALVGGAMGIGVGSLISGDTLFGHRPGAAAVAVADMWARLASAGGTLIDAQWDSPFLRSLGAELVPRKHFLALLGPPAPPLPLPGGVLAARRLLQPPPAQDSSRGSPVPRL